MYYNKDEFLDEFFSLLVFCTRAGYKKCTVILLGIYVEGGAQAPFFLCCLRISDLFLQSLNLV